MVKHVLSSAALLMLGLAVALVSGGFVPNWGILFVLLSLPVVSIIPMKVRSARV